MAAMKEAVILIEEIDAAIREEDTATAGGRFADLLEVCHGDHETAWGLIFDYHESRRNGEF